MDTIRPKLYLLTRCCFDSKIARDLKAKTTDYWRDEWKVDLDGGMTIFEPTIEMGREKQRALEIKLTTNGDDESYCWEIDVYSRRLDDENSLITLEPNMATIGFDFNENDQVGVINNIFLAQFAEEIFDLTQARILVSKTYDETEIDGEAEIESEAEAVRALPYSPFSIFRPNFVPTKNLDLLGALPTQNFSYNPMSRYFRIDVQIFPFAFNSRPSTHDRHFEFVKAMTELLRS